jgi:hypothetical protein
MAGEEEARTCLCTRGPFGKWRKKRGGDGKKKERRRKDGIYIFSEPLVESART